MSKLICLDFPYNASDSTLAETLKLSRAQFKSMKTLSCSSFASTVYFTLVLFSSLSLTSCDCVQSVEGIILDKSTFEPLASVGIATTSITKNTIPKNLISSSEKGIFKFHRMGGMKGCNEISLYFFKNGYQEKNVILKSPGINDTIYLERSLNN